LIVLVVDASIALTWCFEDEVTAETEAIGTRVDSEGAIVPGLWRLEVANTLLLAERCGRIDRSDVEQRLELLRQDVELATLDRDLRRAARKMGVAIVP